MQKRTQQFQLNTFFKRNPNQVFSEIDDEIILLSIDNGEYYNLNNIGGEIWHILKKDTSYQKLIQTLMQTYGVSEEICMLDINAFLRESVKKGIIQIVEK